MKPSGHMLVFTAVLLLASPIYAFYQPIQGRWLSRDPLEDPANTHVLEDIHTRHGPERGPNVYDFVRNTPGSAIDPYGLFFTRSERSREKKVCGATWTFTWREVSPPADRKRGAMGRTVFPLWFPFDSYLDDCTSEDSTIVCKQLKTREATTEVQYWGVERRHRLYERGNVRVVRREWGRFARKVARLNKCVREDKAQCYEELAWLYRRFYSHEAHWKTAKRECYIQKIDFFCRLMNVTQAMAKRVKAEIEEKIDECKKL